MVESRNNPNVRSGQSVGILQITPICVRQCNEILKKQKSDKRYSLADRLSVQKSKEMFILINEYYNPSHNLERMIRSWNGGPNYKVSSTTIYYNKVMKYWREYKK